MAIAIQRREKLPFNKQMHTFLGMKKALFGLSVLITPFALATETHYYYSRYEDKAGFDP